MFEATQANYNDRYHLFVQQNFLAFYAFQLHVSETTNQAVATLCWLLLIVANRCKQLFRELFSPIHIILLVQSTHICVYVHVHVGLFYPNYFLRFPLVQ